MIIKNDKTISSIYKGSQAIGKIYKGTLVVYESFKNLLISGVPPLTLVKSKGVDLIDYKIYGNSIQNGTPTPDAPIEIESVGEYDEETGQYKIPVKVRGKNLWNEKWVNGSITNDAGAFNSSNTNIVCVEDFTSVEPSTQYTLNVGVGNTAWIFQYDSSKGYLGVGKRITVNNFLTFTTDSNTHYIKFYMATGYGNTYKNDVILSLGSTTEEYDPYVEPITTNIYLDKPLGKTDDVAEYIDFQNKEIKSQIKEVIFNGSENWALNTALVDKGVHRFHITISDAYYSSAVSTNNQCKCSHFDTSSNMANANSQGIKNGVYVYTRIAYFYTDATMFPDLETWKEWLSNNNVKFQYKLAEEKSTPTELPNIPTIKGTTIIEVDTNIQPSNMEVTYKGKGE